MSLEVFHLHLSQSERLLWLLEELQIPYKLTVFERDPKTGLGPKGLKDINPAGTAPYFRDTTVSPPVEISESGATVEYILSVHAQPKIGSGAPRLRRSPEDQEFAAYLEWLHFANGTLQPAITRGMTLLFAGAHGTAIWKSVHEKIHSILKLVDDRLANHKWLAGENLSAADIMTVFSLTTMRGFYPVLDLSQHKNILRYLKDVADRPAYREALKKGDKGMEPLIGPKVDGFTQFESFGGLFKSLSE
ncbi:putative glutathione s-transferase [Colletotrichum truncatum]|uniref:Glutathione s-transferase n=1 Tax=Colletotrichum truncatum TaxID=5467 RepID=A0ACC3ZLF3_COLTU|nr:putative glutathione s-transferase [Colletotrichum truncatum]KAF6783922.1 putative glutathione s-transferase [Colletotrichum truncatum]